MPDNKVPLTEFAYRAGVDPQRARAMLMRHELRGERLDGRWYVERREIDRLLRERETAGKGA